MNEEFDIENCPVLDLVSYVNKTGKNMVDKVDNMSYNDVLRLRNEAAECGIEMTPKEVIDLMLLLKEAAK